VTDQNDRLTERRELICAGWEPKDAEGAVVWKSPANGYWYLQALALQLAREGADNHVSKGRGGGTS
jgi:hypothetical protein